MNDGIVVNSLRTTGSIIPQINRSGQEIFGILDYFIGISNISYRSALWHRTVKNKSERENNFEVEKLGAKIL